MGMTVPKPNTSSQERPPGLPVADLTRVDPLERRLARPRGVRPMAAVSAVLGLALVAAVSQSWSFAPMLGALVFVGLLLTVVESVNHTTLRLDGDELVKRSGPLRLPARIVPHLAWRISRDLVRSVDVSAEPLHGFAVTLALGEAGRLLVDEHHRDRTAARRDADTIAAWLGVDVVEHDGEAPRPDPD